MSSLSITSYRDTLGVNKAIVKAPSRSLVNQRILWAVCLSCGVSAFDFTIYVFMSDTLGKVFFPVDVKDYLGKVQTIAFFATGFIARPFGGFWFGRYGDKHGRLPVLRMIMSLLLITTLSAALLPTHALLGLFATVPLIIIRLAQSAAFAGLVILGFVFVAESLPRQRLAINISLVVASFILGVVISSAASRLVIHMLSEQQLLAYGWRLTFLASAILSGVAFLLVAKLDETLLFLKYGVSSDESSQDSSSNNSDSYTTDNGAAAITRSQPFSQQTESKEINARNTLLKPYDFGSIVITVLLAFVFSSLVMLIAMILPKLLMIRFVIDEKVLGMANMGGMVGLIIGIIFYGWLADKIRAGRTLMLGSAILAFLALTLYSYLSHGNATVIIIVYSLLGLGSGVLAMCPVIFIQLYATPKRLTTTGVVFNIVTVLTGALVPFGLYYATNIIAFTPALYITFICGCAFAIGTLINSSPDLNKLEPMPQN